MLPFTLSLGLAVEAARRLTGADGRVELTNARAHRWLTLDRGTLDVLLEAERTPDGVVQIALAGHEPDGRRYAAFGAAVAVDPQRHAPPPAALPDPGRGPVGCTAHEFYHRFAFHGPSFQTLSRVEAIGPDVAVAVVRATAVPDMDVLTVGLDPAVLDAAGQLVAVWLLEHGHRDFGAYPFALDRLTLFAPPVLPGNELRLVARVRRESAGWTEADLEFSDPAGRLVARLEGFRQRLVSFPVGFARLVQGGAPDDEPGTAALPEREFLTANGGIWGQVLAHLALPPERLEEWYRTGRPLRPLEQWLDNRRPASGAVGDRRPAPRLAGSHS
ncbi:MAG TPA: polyketide synthase dehydratase domain-containing protein [Gemmataceae bacterium]|nr:polyketide synthase dehydratase domain-containing protein [Gemmataceae bacterium]